MLNKHDTIQKLWRYRCSWKIYYSGYLRNTVWSADTVTVSVLVWLWAYVNVAVKLNVSYLKLFKSIVLLSNSYSVMKFKNLISILEKKHNKLTNYPQHLM